MIKENIFICEFCGRSFTQKCTKISHENHFCKLNMNKVPIKSHPLSLEHRQKISKALKGKNVEKGNHFSYGIRGYYKGFYCASSFELAFVVYYLDNNMDIKRNTKGYEYIYKGKVRQYFPDFIINDSYFVEIKGYKDETVDYKMKAKLDKPIKLLYRKDLQFAYDYIYKTYNLKDNKIIELYDNFKDIQQGKIYELKKKQQLKYELFKESNQIDSIGRATKAKTSKEELEHRKYMILSSGIDLMRSGWLNKLTQKISLTNCQCKRVVNHFHIPHYTRSSAQGEKNSQYGKHWYINPERTICKSFKEGNQPKNWTKGRIII